MIPSDGDVIEGIASVDESAITGESAPVIRESGWRPLGGHGRYPSAVRPDRGAHHRPARGDVPRPHDRPRRRRQPPEDPERDRPHDPARAPTIIFFLAVRAACSPSPSTRTRARAWSCSSPCWSASSRRRSAGCCQPSASPAWTGSCSATCSPCRAEPSKRPVMCPRSC